MSGLWGRGVLVWGKIYNNGEWGLRKETIYSTMSVCSWWSCCDLLHVFIVASKFCSVADFGPVRRWLRSRGQPAFLVDANETLKASRCRPSRRQRRWRRIESRCVEVWVFLSRMQRRWHGWCLRFRHVCLFWLRGVVWDHQPNQFSDRESTVSLPDWGTDCASFLSLQILLNVECKSDNDWWLLTCFLWCHQQRNHI